MNLPAFDPGAVAQNGEQADIYAALDLGSNSFHLVVARFESGKLIIIDRHKETVRLASGLKPDGTLSKSTVKRALESLHRFSERLAPLHVTNFRVVGTNTLRAARGADSFLERAEDILQSPIEIISGAEEARLIFLGVANDVSPGHKQRLVVDIGGGSTELVVGGRQAEQLESLYMGCVTYSRRFFPEGKITAKAYRKATLAARAEVQSVVTRFAASNWDEAVGSSGTAKAIETVLEGMELSPEHIITRAGLDKLAEALCRFSNSDAIQLPNLSDDRKAVFPGGLAVLHGLFMELGIAAMHVSGYALREGMIFDLAGKDKADGIRAQTVERLMSQYHVDTAQAERVVKLVTSLFDLVSDQFEHSDWLRRILGHALRLHEIGLAISHSSYHKHGAYILLNGEMPGFSKQEQTLMSFLVLNHRRKLRPLPQAYGFDPDWRLVQIVRLACLFCRRRDDSVLPEIPRLKFSGNTLKIWLDQQWLESSPLTAEDLDNEQSYLKSMNLELRIKGTSKRLNSNDD